MGHNESTMTPVSGVDPSHPAYYRRIVTVSIVLGIGLFGIIYLTSRREPAPAQQNTNQVSGIASTPQHFTDVIGQVSAIQDSTMTLRTSITEANGSRRAQDYQVTVDDATALQTVTTTETTTRNSALTVEAIKPGDTLHVFAVENIAVKTSFTATRIIKLVNQ